MGKKAVLKDLNGFDITWVDAIIKALDGIGHPTSVDEIAEYMLSHVISEFPDTAKTPLNTIYMTIYTHTQDSPVGMRDANIFYLHERGKWGLTKWQE